MTGSLSRVRGLVLTLCACAALAGGAPSSARGAGEGTVIGTWSFDDKSLRERIVLERDGQAVFAVVEINGGTPRRIDLAEETAGGKKRYAKKGNKEGEYWLVEADGDLALYDRKGLVRTARKAGAGKGGKEPSYTAEYCYRIGYDYGRAAKLAAVSGKDIKKTVKVVVPEECKGRPETKKGITDGAAAVQY